MSSMLCRKETGGQVRVYDGGLMEQLFVDQNDKIRTMMTSKNSRRRITRPNTTPSPVRNHSRNMDSKSLIGQTMKVQQWLSDKTVKTLQESRATISTANSYKSGTGSSKSSGFRNQSSQSMTEQEKSDLESREARKLYSPILETENTFVKDVEDFIHQRDVTSLRKKEVLHKNWNERVYKPLRKKIIEAMDSNDWPEVDRRKRELHRQYLEFTNEKGHVFLDTMDPEEYYAMALNGHRPAPIKENSQRRADVKFFAHAKSHSKRSPDKLTPIVRKQNTVIETRPLHDPLISQGRQRHEEDRTILRCMTGYRYTDSDIEQVKMPAMPFVPLGRHGTDSVRWLKMPLSNIESTPRQASRRRMVGKFNDTDIDFETWTNTPYNHQAVDRELQIQKKRNYSEDQRPPFPKPVIRRPPPKPVQHSVSFQSPIEQEIPIMAAQPYTMSAPPAVQTVGGD